MAPFLSRAQQRWAYTKSGTESLGGKEKVQEWQNATANSLPERKGKTRTQKARAKLQRGMAGKKR